MEGLGQGTPRDERWQPVIAVSGDQVFAYDTSWKFPSLSSFFSVGAGEGRFGSGEEKEVTFPDFLWSLL